MRRCDVDHLYSNRSYWVPKLAANVERDRRVDAALEAAGWAVLRIWEHVPVDAAVAMVEQALSSRRARSGTRGSDAT